MRTSCRAATLAVASAAGLLLGGCGAGPPGRSATRTATRTAHGLTVRLPGGWQAAATSLTPHLFDPREVLALATYPLRYRPTRCAQVAGSALAGLGSAGAFVTLEERGLAPGSSWAGFPARPRRFGPALGGPSEAAACVPGVALVDHWFAFTDGGRHFHVLVAFGPRATAVTQQQAWSILDSLRVDPRVRPDWRSSG